MPAYPSFSLIPAWPPAFMSMSDPQNPPSNPGTLQGEPSPEEPEATLRQLKSALERNKVIEIAPPAGSKFDPHLHQAISVVPAAEQAPNTIVGVLQKGYTIADRILRPALVTVSSPS